MNSKRLWGKLFRIRFMGMKDSSRKSGTAHVGLLAVFSGRATLAVLLLVL